MIIHAYEIKELYVSVKASFFFFLSFRWQILESSSVFLILFFNFGTGCMSIWLSMHMRQRWNRRPYQVGCCFTACWMLFYCLLCQELLSALIASIGDRFIETIAHYTRALYEIFLWTTIHYAQTTPTDCNSGYHQVHLSFEWIKWKIIAFFAVFCTSDIEYGILFGYLIV